MYTYGVDGLTQPANDLIDAIGRDRFIRRALEGITVGRQHLHGAADRLPVLHLLPQGPLRQGRPQAAETHEELLANVAAVHNPPDVYGNIVTNQAISDTSGT